MPIKTLESFLFERGLVGSYPLDILKNATVGIDVNHYLSRLINNKKNNQLIDSIGNFLPNNLINFLENDLTIFEENKITPIFVFNGLLTVNQLEYYNSSTDLNDNSRNGLGNIKTSINSNKFKVANHRDKSWRSYEHVIKKNENTYIDQPILPNVNENFNYANNINFSTDLRNYLIKFFVEHDISYQIAPYTSWLQLSYLYDSNFIDIIYGPTDCLLLPNMEKFIVGMEFLNKEFRFIDKTKILTDLDLTNEEFIDIAMAIGNDLQPVTLPPLNTINIPPNTIPGSSNDDSNSNANSIFDVAVDMVYNSGTNFYIYQLNNALNDNNKNYLEFYQRGYSSLRNMPVLKANGKVVPYSTLEISKVKDSESPKFASMNNESNKLNNSDNTSANQFETPNDVHDFIGQQLPSEYYFYSSIGLINTKLLETITSGIYYEDIPLSGTISKSYKNLIKKSVKTFKNLEIGLLTQAINRYYQIKSIKDISYNNVSGDSMEEVNLTNKVTPPTFEKINKIIINAQKTQEFSIETFITLLSNSKDLTKDFTSDKVLFPNSVPTENKLNSAFALLSTSLLRTLTLLGFFKFDALSKNHQLTPTSWGKILLKLPSLKIEESKYSTFVILLMFMKLETLKFNEKIEPSQLSLLSQATLRSYPEEATHINILSRLFLLFPIEFNGSDNDTGNNSNYHGPIDKSCLIIRDHFDYINKNLSELFESVLVSSLTSGEFNRLAPNGNIGWKSEIVARLPFSSATPNTVMSMMWVFFLQKYLHNGNNKTDALAFISTEFKTIQFTSDIEDTFKQSLEFLKTILNIFEELKMNNLMESNDFEAINKALKFAERTISSP